MSRVLSQNRKKCQEYALYWRLVSELKNEAMRRAIDCDAIRSAFLLRMFGSPRLRFGFCPLFVYFRPTARHASDDRLRRRLRRGIRLSRYNERRGTVSDPASFMRCAKFSYSALRFRPDSNMSRQVFSNFYDTFFALFCVFFERLSTVSIADCASLLNFARTSFSK